MDAIRKQLDVLMKMDMAPCSKLQSLQLRREVDGNTMILRDSIFESCLSFLITIRISDVIHWYVQSLQGWKLEHDTLSLSRYEEAKAKGLDNYDRGLEDVIDRLIVECDRKITRARKRLEDEDAKAAVSEVM
ncbi:hypothetical protein RHMOL_Rhmol05G0223700 [Rhododendron molle]|uniref:Uncharacterized protein n=1 Tax=Rhododendron molle TaxID=49168 RepID=A0ACC0NSX4_RHOML|nr:hypothetical protein RHMOL_Rhmol05G0223700 [Rhododendron molle]